MIDILSRLSPRENEVLELFAQGFRVTDVAKRLSRSAKTIESHKTRIKIKLAIEDSVQWMTLLRKVSNDAFVRTLGTQSPLVNICEFPDKPIKFRFTLDEVNQNRVQAGLKPFVECSAGHWHYEEGISGNNAQLSDAR